MMIAEEPDGAEKSKRALEGIRVIEIGTFISAPFAATLLADFGADVVKIELPQGGDLMRTLGSMAPGSDTGYWWSSIARNKRSLALDIRTIEGREILARLIQTADVLIENFRPGTLDRWGITSLWMSEQRPDLIVVRISGYGQNGPWRDVPGFDRNAQAFSGLVYVTGDKDTAPQQAGLPVCDFTTGLWAAFGAVTALLAKRLHNDQVGNEIDVALYESMIPFLKDIPMRYKHDGFITERSGNTPDYVSPGGAYLTGDREWIFVSGTGDRVFHRLMNAIGHPEATTSPLFKENKDRVINREIIDEMINEWLASRTTDEALGIFQREDVPAVKIQSIADLMNHPQIIARSNFVDVPDHDQGDVCMTAPVPRLSRMPATIRWSGQHLGESTSEILHEELGISEEQLESLRNRGIAGG